MCPGASMSTCRKVRPRVILVDINVLVAAARAADTYHVAAARFLRETDDRFLVAPTVLAETCYLLHDFGCPASSRGGVPAQHRRR